MSSISVEDQLTEERDEDFLSSNSAARTVAFGTNIQFSKRLRTSLNLSSYSFELPESMTAGEGGLKTVYTSLGLNSTYFLIPDKLKIMGGLMVLRATGVPSSETMVSTVEWNGNRGKGYPLRPDFLQKLINLTVNSH
jgi:hypothetical protein